MTKQETDLDLRFQNLFKIEAANYPGNSRRVPVRVGGSFLAKYPGKIDYFKNPYKVDINENNDSIFFLLCH